MEEYKDGMLSNVDFNNIIEIIGMCEIFVGANK